MKLSLQRVMGVFALAGALVACGGTAPGGDRAGGDGGADAGDGGGNGGGNGGALEASLDGLRLIAERVRLARGETEALSALAYYDDDSTVDVSDQAQWSSSDPGVVAVTGGAHALALAPGEATLSAEWSGVSASVMIEVGPAAAVGIALQPRSVGVAQGAAASVGAVATYTDGTWRDVSADVSWQVGDPTLAGVQAHTAGWRVLGELAGTTSLTAVLDDLSASAQLTVSDTTLIGLEVTPARTTLAPGDTKTFQSLGVYSDSSVQAVAAGIDWRSEDDAVLDALGGGVFSAGEVGATSVSASVDALTATATVVVSDAELRALEITPVTAALAAGTELRLRAHGKYSDGSVRDLSTQSQWSSSNDLALTTGAVDAAGVRIAALAPGDVTGSARIGAFAGSARIVVSDATLSALEITLDATQVAVGATVGYAVTGTFSDGTRQDLTALLALRSARLGIAAPALQGHGLPVLRGVAPGDASLTASSLGVSATASLSVVAATVQSLRIAGVPAELAVGADARARAIGLYTDAIERDVTGLVLWRSDGHTVAVSNDPRADGTLSARGAGGATITASLNGLQANTTVTSIVAPQTPVGLAVLSAPDAIVFGEAATIGVAVRAAAPGATVSDGTLVDLALYLAGADTLLATATLATTDGLALVGIATSIPPVGTVPADAVIALRIEATIPGDDVTASSFVLVAQHAGRFLTVSVSGVGPGDGGIVPAGRDVQVKIANPSNRVYDIGAVTLTSADTIIDAAQGGTPPLLAHQVLSVTFAPSGNVSTDDLLMRLNMGDRLSGTTFSVAIPIR